MLFRSGCGVEARAAGAHWALGSEDWLRRLGAEIPSQLQIIGGCYVAKDRECRGAFQIHRVARPGARALVKRLKALGPVLVSTGDHARNAPEFQQWFGSELEAAFSESPFDKMRRIQALQAAGRRVAMTGDGLNDAGALRQADVGIALVESTAAFSPASDVIIEAKNLAKLSELLEYARRVSKVVRRGFLLSAAYNAVGIGIAVGGKLSPLVCAILMPLSSASVVVFTAMAARWEARRTFGEQSEISTIEQNRMSGRQESERDGIGRNMDKGREAREAHA